MPACASPHRPPTPRPGADVVILMLADGDVTRAVAAEALPAMAAGSVLVDMGTSGPVAEREIARAAAERGVGFVDAPVSGSIALAQAATLTALVGGSAEDVEKVRPALAAMTRAQHHLGDVGAGATVKLALATMIAVTNQSVSELLVLCERAGLERAGDLCRARGLGASPRRSCSTSRPRSSRPTRRPVAFTPLLMLKDLALADALAAEVGAELPAADAARSVLERTVAAGQGDGDLVRVADTLREGSS